jgi:predicted HTH domain antitoxin
MNTHGLNTAIELYRSGTLTLTQAADRAGCTEDQLLAAIRSYGVEPAAGTASPAGAD